MATVLVVEDHADTREVLARLLRGDGYTVVTAGNGSEALTALDETTVDVILLDLMMPGMDGPTFLGILRNDDRHRTKPVVLVTALDAGDLIGAATRYGVFACLLKAHYTPRDMADTINRAIASAARTREAVRNDLVRGPVEE